MKRHSSFTLLTLTALTPLTVGAVDVKMYGQVNKMVYGYSDGTTTEYAMTDNNYSSSRVGVKGEQALEHGLTAGAIFEFEMADNPSHQIVQPSPGVSITTPANPAAATGTMRVGSVSLNHELLGGLSLGRLSTAIDGVMAQDLAGARDVMGADYRKIGGGLKFRQSNGGTLTTQTVNSLTESQNTNRANALRYDSPIWNGLSFKLSSAQGGDTDLALFQEGKFGDFKTKAAMGVYFENDSLTAANGVERRMLGSLSVGHKNGLAGTLAMSRHDMENAAAGSEDPMSLYMKVGYSFDDYELAADYGKAEHFQNITVENNEVKTIGLAGQMNLGHGVSVGLLARNFEAKLTNTPTEDLWLYGTNLRVKF